MTWPPEYQSIFWQLYPRRIDKKKAMAKLEIIRKGNKTPFSDIITGLERYCLWLKGPGWRPEPKWPTTWLNGECWTDELTCDVGTNTGSDRSGESAFLAGMAKVAARYGVAGGNPGGEPVPNGAGASGELRLIGSRKTGDPEPYEGLGWAVPEDLTDPPRRGK